ncbi:MAG TPA: OmpA family protein, partial [Blastocatellia bacterium]|nr:OmpA family protein [Blastocatellia bacterium]
MRFSRLTSLRVVTGIVLIALASVSPIPGQQPKSGGQPPASAYSHETRAMASGQKAKITGSIVRRDADTFTVRDNQNLDTVVLLTDQTSVKSKGGFFRFGKNYDVTNLVSGLPVEVEGIGNREGQLVADKVRFESSDLKMAKLVDKRVGPIEEANQRLAGQVDELGEVSKLAREDAGRANERISSLDDYTVQDSTTIHFKVNSAVITPDQQRMLDELAQKATATKGYVIEIKGYADSTGDPARNRVLSQQRADAVVRYLSDNHDIPLRRMITPFGYGEVRPVADNSSAQGRQQNRRVEVKVLISR